MAREVPMRKLKYNHHIETDADFAVIDDADSCRWYEYMAEDFYVDVSHVQGNIYRVRSTERFAGGIVGRNFCYSHEIDTARSLCIAFMMLWETLGIPEFTDQSK
jgi:hypothetical protein